MVSSVGLGGDLAELTAREEAKTDQEEGESLRVDDGESFKPYKEFWT